MCIFFCVLLMPGALGFFNLYIIIDLFCFLTSFYWVCYNIFNCPDLFVFSTYRECPVHILYKFVFIAQCKTWKSSFEFVISVLINWVLWFLNYICTCYFSSFVISRASTWNKRIIFSFCIDPYWNSFVIQCINEKDGFRSFSHTIGVEESPKIKDFPRFKYALIKEMGRHARHLNQPLNNVQDLQ